MEDRELVQEVLQKGNKQCFAEIVGRYSGMVFSKAIGIVKREELAKEVTQQTFIKAYTRLEYWRSNKLGPWLVSIAMHTALNELEREKKTAPLPAKEWSEEGDTFAEREELLLRMEQALAVLPEQDRRLIQLHYYKQFKTDEIARLMGMTQSNVLVRLHRIRERLKKEMQTKETKYGTEES